MFEETAENWLKTEQKSDHFVTAEEINEREKRFAGRIAHDTKLVGDIGKHQNQRRPHYSSSHIREKAGENSNNNRPLQ